MHLRWTLRLASLTALSLAALVRPQPASADSLYHYVRLTCDGNRALIRFAPAVNAESPVFPAVPAGTKPFDAPPAPSNRCTLSDGREVLVKMGLEQPRPYGMCGGGTNSFASLWVGGRKVLSRQQTLRACFPEDYADVFILDGARLFLCRSAESAQRFSGQEIPVAARCLDASGRMAAAEPDAVEYPPDGAAGTKRGAILVTHAEDPTFCAGFLNAGPPVWPEMSAALLTASAPDSAHDAGFVNGPPPGGEPRGRGGPVEGGMTFRYPADVVPVTLVRIEADFRHRFETATTGKLRTGFSSVGDPLAHVDFDNDGTKDIVLVHEGGSGYLDGTIFHVASGGADAQAPRGFSIAIPARDRIAHSLYLSRIDLGAAGNYSGPFPGFAPDYRDRYTRQKALRHGGETLVFATPTNRRVRPTAIVYRPRAGGAAEPVCVFQRVEENY